MTFRALPSIQHRLSRTPPSVIYLALRDFEWAKQEEFCCSA
jgi:hypothetical protein